MRWIKSIFFAIHVLGWILIFLFFNWMFHGERVPNPVSTAGILTLMSLPIFYSHFILLTRYFNRRKIGIYVTGLIITLLVSPFLFLGGFKIDTEKWSTLPFDYFLLLGLTFLMVILSWVARTTENWFINFLKRETLEKQKMRAELAYLKSQINPHFLFNTLNNIHTLAYKQSPSTPDAIMRLSSLMRYMLYESNADTVSLNREIDYLHDYINLQQLRYKQGPVVDIKIVGNTDSCNIAPLLFIHLVENAYKHSHAQLDVGDIKVRIEIKDNSLSFSIQNPVGNKKLNAIHEAGGIGLANVQKRLQLLYPDQHHFEINRSEAFFNVVLKIHHHHLSDHETKVNMLYSG